MGMRGTFRPIAVKPSQGGGGFNNTTNGSKKTIFGQKKGGGSMQMPVNNSRQQKKYSSFGDAIFGKRKKTIDNDSIKVRFMEGKKDSKGIQIKFNPKENKKRYEISIGEDIKKEYNYRDINRKVAEALDKKITIDSKSAGIAKKKIGLERVKSSDQRKNIKSLRQEKEIATIIKKDIAGALGRAASRQRGAKIKNTYKKV